MDESTYALTRTLDRIAREIKSHRDELANQTKQVSRLADAIERLCKALDKHAPPITGHKTMDLNILNQEEINKLNCVAKGFQAAVHSLEKGEK